MLLLGRTTFNRKELMKHEERIRKVNEIMRQTGEGLLRTGESIGIAHLTMRSFMKGYGRQSLKTITLIDNWIEKHARKFNLSDDGEKIINDVFGFTKNDLLSVLMNYKEFYSKRARAVVDSGMSYEDITVAFSKKVTEEYIESLTKELSEKNG